MIDLHLWIVKTKPAWFNFCRSTRDACHKEGNRNKEFNCGWTTYVLGNTNFVTAAAFIKSWTLRNTGDTCWDATYLLHFASGANMTDHLDIPATGTSSQMVCQ